MTEQEALANWNDRAGPAVEEMLELIAAAAAEAVQATANNGEIYDICCVESTLGRKAIKWLMPQCDPSKPSSWVGNRGQAMGMAGPEAANKVIVAVTGSSFDTPNRNIFPVKRGSDALETLEEMEKALKIGAAEIGDEKIESNEDE